MIRAFNQDKSWTRFIHEQVAGDVFYPETIDGIFATTLTGALGMAAALADLRKSGIEVNAKFIGFDTSPKLIQGIQNGTIDGLVAQAPKRMGYLAVETLVKHLRGEQVESQIDTQVEMVTKERLENEAAIRELVGMKP